MRAGYMKLGFSLSIVTVLLSLAAGQVSAQQQGVDTQLQQQLNAAEQSEYQQRIDAASGERQRNEIHNEYRNMAQDRARLKDGSHSEQRGTGKGKGKGGQHSQQGGSAGNKNKSHKSGK